MITRAMYKAAVVKRWQAIYSSQGFTLNQVIEMANFKGEQLATWEYGPEGSENVFR